MPPQMPSALLRSAPSVNMFMTIESAAGSTIAAPSPWAPRIAIRNESVVASPQPSEASVKTARPTMKITAAAEQVGGPPAQQQEAAKGQPVGGHDPLQVRLREVQLAADRRKRDVNDRQVGDGHEERNRQHCERAPTAYRQRGARDGCSTGHDEGRPRRADCLDLGAHVVPFIRVAAGRRGPAATRLVGVRRR